MTENQTAPNFSWVSKAMKYGQGVMGKSSIVLITIILLAIAVVIHPTPYGIAVLIIVLVAYFLWFRDIKQYAIEHPELALAEGAVAQRWDREIQERKGKTISIIMDTKTTPGIPNPDTKMIEHDTPSDA